MGVTPKGEFRPRMSIPTRNDSPQVVKQTIHIDIISYRSTNNSAESFNMSNPPVRHVLLFRVISWDLLWLVAILPLIAVILFNLISRCPVCFFFMYSFSVLNQFSHIDRHAGGLSVFPQVFRVEQVAVSDSWRELLVKRIQGLMGFVAGAFHLDWA